MSPNSSLVFACPACYSLLKQSGTDVLDCKVDGLCFKRIDGIWRMLLPGREGEFIKFLHDYEIIRQAEGRGSDNPGYYRALPFRDLNKNLINDWRIRAASLEALLKRVVEPMEQTIGRSLRVLDLGAGNCWLSNILAQRKHSIAAVDLLTNDLDGLGCSKYYETVFVPVQAEFDRLPFPERAAELVIFNASFHYSINYSVTLKEAVRTLETTGKIVILDSPCYRGADSGAKMVAERQAFFQKRYGFPSNALPSENYLTYQRLDQLGKSLHLRWKVYTPNYGLGWFLRPWIASLSGQREPAKFHLIVAEKETAG